MIPKPIKMTPMVFMMMPSSIIPEYWSLLKKIKKFFNSFNLGILRCNFLILPQIQCLLSQTSDTAGNGEHECSDSHASMNGNHSRAEFVSGIFAAQQNEEAVNKENIYSNSYT